MSQSTGRQRMVRYDPMLPTAKLFRSVGKGRRPKLDESCVFAGVEWRFRGPDLMGIPEQTLLLVLLELANEQLRVDDGFDPVEAPLLDGLHMTGGLVAEALDRGSTGNLASLTVSFGELNRRCGRGIKGGTSVELLHNELQRLCEVTVWAKSPDGVIRSSRLLHWQRGDRVGVNVVLNWRLSEILIGQQFSLVSLTERLSLKSDIAKALHCALSVRLRMGETRTLGLETLATYVWFDVDVAPSTNRRRRQLLRGALDEIGELRGWYVGLKDRGAIKGDVTMVVHRKSKTQQAAKGRAENVSRKAVLEPISGTADVADAVEAVDLIAFFGGDEE